MESDENKLIKKTFGGIIPYNIARKILISNLVNKGERVNIKDIEHEYNTLLQKMTFCITSVIIEFFDDFKNIIYILDLEKKSDSWLLMYAPISHFENIDIYRDFILTNLLQMHNSNGEGYNVSALKNYFAYLKNEYDLNFKAPNTHLPKQPSSPPLVSQPLVSPPLVSPQRSLPSILQQPESSISSESIDYNQQTLLDMLHYDNQNKDFSLKIYDNVLDYIMQIRTNPSYIEDIPIIKHEIRKMLISGKIDMRIYQYLLQKLEDTKRYNVLSSQNENLEYGARIFSPKLVKHTFYNDSLVDMSEDNATLHKNYNYTNDKKYLLTIPNNITIKKYHNYNAVIENYNE